MKLEKIQPLGEHQERALLMLENGEKLRTDAAVVADLGLYAGRELSDEELLSLREAVRKQAVRLRAARIVSASGVSEKELRRRLARKGESPEDAAEAAEWLRSLHVLNDADTAAQLAQSAARRGYGRARIRNILYEKGIPQELWEDAMANLPQADGPIDRFLAQRFSGGDPDEKTVQKAVDALRRRGHSWKDIQEGLRRYQSDLELREADLEEP